MPVTYQLDRAGRLVVTTCAGEVTLGEVLEHFRELEAQPSLPERLDVLLDLSAVSSLPKSDQVREAARSVERLTAKLTWGYLCIVASRDALFGMSRVFEALTETFFEEVCVFRRREDAEQWLTTHRARRT